MKSKTTKCLLALLILGLAIATENFVISFFNFNYVHFFNIYFTNMIGPVSSYASLSFFICIFLRNFLKVSIVALAICVILLSTAVGEVLEVLHGIGENHIFHISDFLFRFLGTIIGSAFFIFGAKIYKNMTKG